MDALQLDPGKNLKLIVRKAREHTLVFLAKDTSGNAYTIEDEFAFGVKRDPRDKNYLFQLTTTDDDGITVDGNEMSVPLSEDLTNLDGAREYYFELVNLTQKKNWAQGPFVVLTGPAPSSGSTSSSATLSVNTGDSVVEITVQAATVPSGEELIDALGYTPEDAAKKGQPDGYASLDDEGKVPLDQVRGALTRLIETEFSEVVNLDGNYRSTHTIAGAIAYTKGDQPHQAGNIREDFLTANGINKPTFSSDFVVVWDNWVNTINTLNIIRFEYMSNGKIAVDLRWIE